MTREEALNICKREQYCVSHDKCTHGIDTNDWLKRRY